MIPVPSALNRLPVATLMAVLFTVATAIVSLVDPDVLTFVQFNHQVIAFWSFLVIGRGLAFSEVELDSQTPVERFLNTFPWGTVVVGVVALEGYLGILLKQAVTFNELGVQLAVLIGALGVGRGTATLKKHLMVNNPAVKAHWAPEGGDEVQLVNAGSTTADVERDPSMPLGFNKPPRNTR